jgi:tetratricopeptide (TPR) repeat protein
MLMEGVARHEKNSLRIRNAIPLYEELLERTTNSYGAEHPQTLVRQGELGYCYQKFSQYKKAIETYQANAELRDKISGAQHELTLVNLFRLADCYSRDGQHEKSFGHFAELLKREKEKHGDEHNEVAATISAFGSAQQRAKKYEDALASYRRAFEMYKKVNGLEKQNTLAAMYKVCIALKLLQKYDESLALLRQNLELRGTVLGQNHIETRATLKSISDIYIAQKKFELAVNAGKDYLDRTIKKNGEKSAPAISAMNSLAKTYEKAGMIKEQLAILQSRFELIQETTSFNNKVTDARNLLAIANRKANEFKKAIDLHQRNLGFHRTDKSPDHKDTITSMGNLAYTYLWAGDYQKASELYQERYQLFKSKKGATDKEIVSAWQSACNSALAANEFTRAEMTVNDLIKPDNGQPTVKVNNPGTIKSILAIAYLGQGKLEQARAESKTAVDIFAKIKTPNEPVYSRARTVFAASITDKKDFASAEKQLLDAHQTIQTMFSTGKLDVSKCWQVLNSLQRIIDFYQRFEKPEQVRTWKQKKSDTEKKIAELRKSKIE